MTDWFTAYLKRAQEKKRKNEEAERLGPKRCMRCAEWKDRRDFTTHNGCSDGLSAWCKPCKNAKAREYGKRGGYAPRVIVKAQAPVAAPAPTAALLTCEFCYAPFGNAKDLGLHKTVAHYGESYNRSSLGRCI